MLPFRHVGDTKSEHWFGLIDAVYAIAMTVLALTLPDFVGNCIELYHKSLSISYLWFGLYQAAFYFFSFLLLYEIWCFHRSFLVASSSKSRQQNIYTGLLLGIVCLTPPIAAALLKSIDPTGFWTDYHLSGLVTAFGWLLVSLVFFLLGLIAAKSESIRSTSALKTIHKAARFRCALFVVIALFQVIQALLVNWPFLPAAVVMAAYIFFSFNQDSVIGIMCRP